MAQPIFSFRDSILDGIPVRIATFEIPGGLATPSEFAAATTELGDSLTGQFGVILDGRGPVWGFGMLMHAAHPSLFVATRDPRFGAVVVQSHALTVKPGDIIDFPTE